MAISACQATEAETLVAHADDSVKRAIMARSREIRDEIGIRITVQVEDITPASGDNCYDHQSWMSCHPGGGPRGLSIRPPSDSKDESVETVAGIASKRPPVVIWDAKMAP